MLRITILAVAFAGICCAQNAEELFNRPPESVDKALRARITEFYADHINREYRKAEALVAEDTKDFFYANNKPSYISCEIRTLKYLDDFRKAKAMVVCKMFLMMPGFTDKPVDMPIGSTWKIEDGKWMWYVDEEARRASPFGKMTAGPPSANAPSTSQGGLPTIPSSPDFLYDLVKVDKREVMVIQGSGAEVTITNTAPGVMNLEVTGKIKGVEAELDKTSLKANEKAVLTVKAEPAAVSGTLQIFVSPIQQLIPIQVNVK